MELPNNIGMNKYVIELIDRNSPFYKSIYTFSPVKLEILKTYIIIHLKTRFIWHSKSFADAFIFFDKKFDDSFCLYVAY